MNPNDLKPGAVYTYSRSDDLYLVVKVIDALGAHMWLRLSGLDAGETGVEGRPGTYGWERYSLVEEAHEVL